MANETDLIFEEVEERVIKIKLDGAEEVDIPTRKTRYSICQSCEKLDKRWAKCQICNCWMPVKARLPGMKCPIGKW